MKKQFLFQTCIAVLLLVSPWLSKQALALTWNIQTIDSTGDVGCWTSIAMDANDYPHISYYDDTNYDLKYAAFNGSTWDINIIDSTVWVGEYTSIALDADDYAHISYYDGTNHDLKYAAFNGSTWGINIVDSTGVVGQFTSIALDANGHPHISYFDATNYDLKYAYAYCGYVIDGDNNDDCKVDFRDFALMATNWLIDCDRSPLDPACVPK